VTRYVQAHGGKFGRDLPFVVVEQRETLGFVRVLGDVEFGR
jgi:hypothetical protein